MLEEMITEVTQPADSTREWTVRGIQWPSFRHGTETWVLWVKRGKTRVEKVDGKWTLEQLGYEVGRGR